MPRARQWGTHRTRTFTMTSSSLRSEGQRYRPERVDDAGTGSEGHCSPRWSSLHYYNRIQRVVTLSPGIHHQRDEVVLVDGGGCWPRPARGEQGLPHRVEVQLP